jgi:peptidyl-prolyl cis-trans isomerase D
MQVVMGLIVVAFVGWGVAPQGDTAQNVAIVNGVGISDIEFSRFYRQRERQMEQRSSLNDEQRGQLREQVKQSLIQEEVLLQEADGMGLEVSDSEVAHHLLSSYDFLNDADGIFSERNYSNFLRRNGMTRSDFEETLREELLRNKLRELIWVGASVSDPLVEQTYVEENTEIDIRHVRVVPKSIEATIEIDPAELATWVTENSVAIKEVYDRDFSREYDVPQKLTLSVIRLSIRPDGLQAGELRPRMDAIRADLEAGADFSDLARRWSEDPSAISGGDMGTVTSIQLGSVVSDALSKVEVGALSEVVATDNEIRLFRVHDRADAHVIPIGDAQDGIATRLLREQRAPVRAAEIADQEILPAWKETGVIPVDVLAKYGLSADATGLRPLSAPALGAFSPPAEMFKAARKASVNDVLPEVYDGGSTLWVGQLIERIEADMEKFAEEGDALRETTLARRRNEFFQAWVNDAVSRASVQIN